MRKKKTPINEYQLTRATYQYVQVVVSLNRVQLENYKTHDAVLTKLLELAVHTQVKNPVSFVGVRKSCT